MPRPAARLPAAPRTVTVSLHSIAAQGCISPRYRLICRYNLILWKLPKGSSDVDTRTIDAAIRRHMADGTDPHPPHFPIDRDYATAYEVIRGTLAVLRAA